MKHQFTPSASKDEPNQLVYSPENDEFVGIEKFSDIFDVLDQNTYKVDDHIMGKIIHFAENYPPPGR